MTIGERIRKLRDRLTLAEFGQLFNQGASNISSIEKGNSNPSFDLAVKICEHFGVSMDWLIRGVDDGMSNIEKYGEKRNNGIGERIKEIRGRQTLDEFCDSIGNIIKTSNLLSIERNDSNPSITVLMAISDVYNCSLDWLLRGIGSKTIDEIPNFVKEQEIVYQQKYYDLLERHNKVLEDRVAYQSQQIRSGQLQQDK